MTRPITSPWVLRATSGTLPYKVHADAPRASATVGDVLRRTLPRYAPDPDEVAAHIREHDEQAERERLDAYYASEHDEHPYREYGGEG